MEKKGKELINTEFIGALCEAIEKCCTLKKKVVIRHLSPEDGQPSLWIEADWTEWPDEIHNAVRVDILDCYTGKLKYSRIIEETVSDIARIEQIKIQYDNGDQTMAEIMKQYPGLTADEKNELIKWFGEESIFHVTDSGNIEVRKEIRELQKQIKRIEEMNCFENSPYEHDNLIDAAQTLDRSLDRLAEFWLSTPELQYEDFYRIAEHEKAFWTADLSPKEVAENASNYLCAYRSSRETGRVTMTIVQLVQAIMEDQCWDLVGVLDVRSMEKILQNFLEQI